MRRNSVNWKKRPSWAPLNFTFQDSKAPANPPSNIKEDLWLAPCYLQLNNLESYHILPKKHLHSPSFDTQAPVALSVSDEIKVGHWTWGNRARLVGASSNADKITEVIRAISYRPLCPTKGDWPLCLMLWPRDIRLELHLERLLSVFLNDSSTSAQVLHHPHRQLHFISLTRTKRVWAYKPNPTKTFAFERTWRRDRVNNRC